MISSSQYNQKSPQQVLPILSINKFAHCLGIHRGKIEKLADETVSYYAPFQKKTGTKERTIDNPRGLLKEVQKRMNDRILDKFVLPDFVIGGVKGKRPNEHPGRHVNKPLVITFDIKDCFPNITSKQVFDIWHKQLGCSHEVARLATKLTTRIGHLPLGAPTSLALANIALQPCLSKVAEIAEHNGFLIGQYVDDLAFSGAVLPQGFMPSIVEEFIKYGFKLKSKKIKVMRANKPQIVTKKLVNRKVSIPRIERNKIRAALHELHNVDVKSSTYGKQYRSLKGRINNLGDFHPVLAEKIREQFKQLYNPDKRS